mmetsp:Transcript_33974/g.69253  ORF Transcript_33974/g.69253 Transcript_33974/m.69253 type:complete len:1177 (+) Transcript_33974:31-3561(+)
MVSTHAWRAPGASPPTNSSNNSTSIFGNNTHNSSGGSSPFQRSPSSQTSSGGNYNIMSNSSLFGNNAASSSGGGMTSRPFIGGGGGGGFGQQQHNTNTTPGVSTSAAAAAGDFNSLLANSNSLLSSIGRSHYNHSTATSRGSNTTTNAGIGGSGDTTQQSSSSAATQPRFLGDKSLTELSVASRLNTSNTSSTTTHSTNTYEAEASAHRLFAREGNGFDSARLGRSVRELEMRVATSSNIGGGGGEEKKEMDHYNTTNNNNNANTAGGNTNSITEQFDREQTATEIATLGTLNGSSLQQILSLHSEHCVQLAIRGANDWTAKQKKERVKNRLKRDWEVERREILGRGVLGHRFLMNVGGGEKSGGDKYLLGGEGVASNVPLLEGGATSTTRGSGSASSSLVYSNIIPSSQSLPTNIQGLIKTHLVSIDQHLNNNTNNNTGSKLSEAMTLLTSLQEGLKELANNNSNNTNEALNPESMNGYSNTLSLLKSILNCSISLGVVPTSTSSSATDVAMNVMGSCNFFAYQFKHHVGTVVREAELSGLNTTSGAAASGGGEGLISSARDVRTFTSIVAGSELVNGQGGVWPQLYYALRCGDALAAESIVKQYAAANNNNSNGDESFSGVDPAVLHIISQLVELQQDQQTIFGDSTNGNTRSPQQVEKSLLSPSQTMLQSRRQVCELYERTKTRMSSLSGGANVDMPFVPYRAACLALLGGAESISEVSVLESSGLVKTVEDYLYASLWHALHLADTTSSIGGEGGLQNVSRAVARLGKLVNQWGPSYFEQQDDFGDVSASSAVAAAAGVASAAQKMPVSGGWAYTLPLLASQQYATALAYLAEAGGGLGLLQATHVGVLMDAAGLSVSDYSNASNAPSQTLVPMLVASFSASLQGLDAEAALKYLVLLSGKGKFVKEQVQRLLLETRQFEILAGKLASDGSRSNAALDSYFSKSHVSSILADGANVAIQSGKPADAAELLVLSGHFGALFTLMNRELAAYLVASTQEEFTKRQFWFNAASQFHAIHLAHGKMYVQNALESEGRMSLGNTFQLLMNLVVFFDRCRENQWEGAWVLMDNLNLLPKADSEMTVKVEAFFQLDNCVKQIFHHVVLAAMEALCHLFRSLRQDGAGVSIQQQNTIDQRLDELRTHARLLVTFSRLLNLPGLGDGDTYVRIAQLEKNMM